MELIFESRSNFSGFIGDLRGVQVRPTVEPEAVLVSEPGRGGCGVSIYGTVLKDQGRFRMWYQARVRGIRMTRRDTASVAYAESDDGLEWRRPILDPDGVPRNRCHFGLHCPSVWIDPDAPAAERYRGCGFGSPALHNTNQSFEHAGYYTVYSADGFDWKMEAKVPQWPYGDVITSVYHPGQQRALYAMKRYHRRGGVYRRSIHAAERIRGAYGPAVSALIPDEYDDLLALQRGYAGCDYYGMGLLPAGSGTVGFLWNYWHGQPYSRATVPLEEMSEGIGLYGASDVTLTYQEEPGGVWMHMPGRPAFFDRREQPWMSDWVHTASSPIEVGDEEWLYFTGIPFEHGYPLNPDWSRHEGRGSFMERQETSRIGLIRWPRHRLFGLESSREGAFTINLGHPGAAQTLRLNYRTRSGGSVRVELPGHDRHTLEAAVPLEGDSLSEPVRWKHGTQLPTVLPGETLHARLHLERATVHAYGLGADDLS